MGDSEALGGNSWLYQNEDGEDKDRRPVTQLALTEH